MAAIRNLNGLSPEQVSSEVQRGGRFVMFEYTISLLIVTLQRSSDIYFVPANEKGLSNGLPFVVLSLTFGWWGLPWGPIKTVRSIACNLAGGKDVTAEVMGLMDALGNGKFEARRVA